jgi:hypothetical protein
MSYIGNEPIVSATRTITEVTATAGQTVFNANGGYTVGYLDVFLNGSQLQTVDFTATNGSSVTLTEAAQVNDVVRLVAWGTFSTNSIQGNLTLTGTAARITGDFSNATLANRVSFQTSTTNGNTVINAIPNGTSLISTFQANNNADPTNAGYFRILSSSTDSRLESGVAGTGTYLPLTMYTGGSERLRIDTSGNVGIGTSSPEAKLQVNTGTNNRVIFRDAAHSTLAALTSAITFSRTDGITNLAAVMGWNNGGLALSGREGLAFATGGGSGYTETVERMRIDSSGNLLFNSGYGSVATAYGCRAWVNFNGTGTVAIRASGNVSSITDLGTGYYTVNFTTALADANYAINVTGSAPTSSNTAASGVATNAAPTTTAVRITFNVSGVGQQDPQYTNVSVFR